LSFYGLPAAPKNTFNSVRCDDGGSAAKKKTAGLKLANLSSRRKSWPGALIEKADLNDGKWMLPAAQNVLV